jgi:hypothetical protein
MCTDEREKICTEIGLQDVDWIYLAEDINKWQAVVNIVMNFQVS